MATRRVLTSLANALADIAVDDGQSRDEQGTLAGPFVNEATLPVLMTLHALLPDLLLPALDLLDRRLVTRVYRLPSDEDEAAAAAAAGGGNTGSPQDNSEGGPISSAEEAAAASPSDSASGPGGEVAGPSPPAASSSSPLSDPPSSSSSSSPLSDPPSSLPDPDAGPDLATAATATATATPAAPTSSHPNPPHPLHPLEPEHLPSSGLLPPSSSSSCGAVSRVSEGIGEGGGERGDDEDSDGGHDINDGIGPPGTKPTTDDRRPGPDPAPPTAAFYLVYEDVDVDGDEETAAGGGGDGGIDGLREYVVRLRAWNCTCAEFALGVFGGGGGGDGGRRRRLGCGSLTGVDAFWQGMEVDVEEEEEEQEGNEKEVEEEEERVVEDVVEDLVESAVLGASNEDKAAVEETVLEMVDTVVRAVETDEGERPTGGDGVHSPTVSPHEALLKKIVDDVLWQAGDGALSQEPVTQEGLPRETPSQEASDQEASFPMPLPSAGFSDVASMEGDRVQDDDTLHAEEQDYLGGQEFPFGGLTLDMDGAEEDDYVPCCKHLLAGYLAETCRDTALGNYVENQGVNVYELAGMAAGS